MAKFRRIGVLTSGGDAPGMNAAIRAVTRAALAEGVEVMGIYEGYKGLIYENMKLFHERDVSNIIGSGGTILYSDRCDEFRYEEGLLKAKQTCADNDIDGIIAIGGDGTFRGATDFTAYGVPCIGIPATIDNDITSTDYSIGFDTAMNTVVSMVDRLRDTCDSHRRCNVVEVMGRGAGYIALQAGIATGASVIALKEVPFDEEEAMRRLLAAKENLKRNFIVVVAEGIPLDIADDKLYSEKLAERIGQATEIETKFARLAHVVRGGSPTLRDRLLASQLGAKAVELLLRGESNLVVGVRDDKLVATEIGYALTLDRMYKGMINDQYESLMSPAELSKYQNKKLTAEELSKYTAKQLEEMRALCGAKLESFKTMYQTAHKISM